MICNGFLNQSVSKLANLTSVNIVADGNSLTDGFGSTSGNTYPEQLTSSYPFSLQSLPIDNVAVSGQTTLNMIANGAANVDTLIDVSKVNILLAWEIRNHLVVDAPTNTVAYDKWIEYCDDRTSAGWKVIIATILPSWQTSYRGDATVTGYEQLNTDRLSINQDLRDNWADFADGIADLAYIPSIGTFGNNEQSGYTFSTSTRPTTSENGLFYDGTHLTNAGYAVVAECFKEAIWRLL